jgi:DNA-binding NtrC family response regulator
MASRKTTFEVVKLDDIAALLGDAQEAGVKVAPKPARILSVTYDQSLAVTREMLFASVGFQVSSALTIDQAIQFCAAESFDLVVVGHSIPRERRQLLLQELRRRWKTPILALQRHGETPLTGADYIFDSADSPALLLKTVVNILEPRNGACQGGKRKN